MAGYAGRDAVIVGAVRTPIGKGKASGALHDVLPVDLLAHSLKELVASDRDRSRARSTTSSPARSPRSATRRSTSPATRCSAPGFPESVPGTTDRPAVRQQPAGHQLRRPGRHLRCLRHRDRRGCGVDGPSPRWARACCPAATRSARCAARYPEGLVPQGISAELIAAKWGFSRQQLDEFSAGSHEKAAAATKEGRFDNELAPIAGLSTDEIIRPGTTVETLAGLKPAFYNPAYEARFPQIKWEITPGNSSPLSDGSAAVLITTSEVAKRLGLRPLARIHSTTVVGSDPLYMLTGVIPATEKVLDPRRFDARRHRPVRGERGVRSGGAGVGPRYRRRPGEDERQRRRHRDRPSAWAPAVRAS